MKIKTAIISVAVDVDEINLIILSIYYLVNNILKYNKI